LPPDSQRWIGSFEKNEVAEVWPEGIGGNKIEKWHWLLTVNRKSGYVVGTGDNHSDLYAAQDCASQAFFEDV
jgi:hypothetical protein